MFTPLMINLIGNDKDIDTVSKEISQICTSNGIGTKIISINPTCLACEPTNNIPEWRNKLYKQLSSQPGVIINKAGEANCDEITDLCRSIRALSYSTQPYALKVEFDTKTADEKMNILQTCSQLNMVYSIKSDAQEKIKQIEQLLGKY